MSKSLIFGIILFQLLNQGNQDQLSARYEGSWKRGEKHGDGTYFFPNGDRYEGKWKRGKQHDDGTYFFPNGDRYEGKWEGGKNTDRASIFFLMETLLWDNGKMANLMEKECTLIRAEKNFVGEWKDGKKQLQGPLILSD